MIQPFDTIINVWMTALPIYEWELEPAPVVEAPAGPELPLGGNAGKVAADGANTSADAANATANLALAAAKDESNGLPPPMRLVFKGLRWVATPVWGIRENPVWDQMAQLERDEDQKRNRSRAAGTSAHPTPPKD
jgi:hypothetical protein